MDYSKPFLGKKVTVTVDRPIGSTHSKHEYIYPVNYGFIAGVMAPDGEDLDAYIIGVDEPVKNFEGICIAIIHRLDDDDDKLIVCKENESYTDDEIRSAVKFQEQWFESELIRA